MECLDENENHNHMIIEDNDESIDDSYIKAEDKKNLLITIKKIYETNMAWADDILLKCMIKEHYKSVIKNINKQDYLEEISKSDINTLLDQL
jgi:uncharacterized FlgJ-related protein